MHIVYSDRYGIDIGDHVFPTAKFELVRRLLVEQSVVRAADIVEPVAATWDELGLVHDIGYIEKTRTGAFRPSELAQLEMPWSTSMAEGFRLMAGGSVTASRLAVGAASHPRNRTVAGEGGAPYLAAAAHLGGGFHHAFPDHGEGFCLYNDVALAVRVVQREELIERAAVVDCDVHHGNGTAHIFRDDPSVFTLSIHQEHNYPVVKPPSSLDVGLADGTGDAEYLQAVARALPAVMASRPDLIVYVAGADPYIEDKLGGLSLTRDGLRARDRLVLETAGNARIPVVIVLSGGYARRLEDTAAIHAATIEEAARLSA